MSRRAAVFAAAGTAVVLAVGAVPAAAAPGQPDGSCEPAGAIERAASALGNWMAPRPAREARSTGTVVVARSASCDAVEAVGTSTVTVAGAVTAADVTAELVAPDGSEQRYAVLDERGRRKTTAPVADGDRLVVTSEDGAHRSRYRIEVRDAGAGQRDGVYWNQRRYDEVDTAVNRNTPVFAARTCDVTAERYADRIRQVTETFAVGNQAGDPAQRESPLVYDSQRVWYYTDAIRAAIDDCHEAGGGVVVIPAGGSRNDDGAYYSGAIHLRSNVNLRVEKGATVKFLRTRSNEFYPVVPTSYEGTDLYNFSPFIYAYGQRNVAVTGGGLLDGQEDMWNWRPWKKGYWGELNVENRDPDCGYGCQGLLNTMNHRDVPFTQRLFTADGSLPETIPVLRDGAVAHVPPPDGARAYRSAFRPTMIGTYHSRNILIEDIRLRNTPFWMVHPVNSENVLIRDVDIYSDKTKDFESRGWNNDDGLNPESSRNVVLERNRVTVSDDGSALKSGRNRNGREHRGPTEGVIIRDSRYWNEGGGSAGISAGSEMSGGVRDVFIHDNEFGGVGLSLLLKIKTNAYRGGVVENFYLRDNVLHQALSGMVQLDAGYRETFPVPGGDRFDPTIRNIHLDDVNTAPGMRPPDRSTFQFAGVARSPVENVYYRDSVFHSSGTLPAGFARNKNIRNFVVDGVRYVHPSTGAVTEYTTTPLRLSGTTVAQTGGDEVPLTERTIADPDVVTRLPDRTFRLRGAVDLEAYPRFVADGGTVRVFVDRDRDPVPATLHPDGSFVSDAITIRDDAPWYADRNYLAVNLYDAGGLNMHTVVYQVAAE